MRVGDIIRKRREELRLSQGRLASRAGLSQSYLSKIEGGSVKSPGPGALHSLAGVLHIDPHNLLLEAGYPLSGGQPPARVPAPVLPAWTSWQSLPPCLRAHGGWVCPACRHWPHDSPPQTARFFAWRV